MPNATTRSWVGDLLARLNAEAAVQGRSGVYTFLSGALAHEADPELWREIFNVHYAGNDDAATAARCRAEQVNAAIREEFETVKRRTREAGRG